MRGAGGQVQIKMLSAKSMAREVVVETFERIINSRHAVILLLLRDNAP